MHTNKQNMQFVTGLKYNREIELPQTMASQKDQPKKKIELPQTRASKKSNLKKN